MSATVGLVREIWSSICFLTVASTSSLRGGKSCQQRVVYISLQSAPISLVVEELGQVLDGLQRAGRVGLDVAFDHGVLALQERGREE